MENDFSDSSRINHSGFCRENFEAAFSSRSCTQDLFNLNKNRFYVSLLVMILPFFLKAQIVGDAPPFVLSVNQLLNWTSNGSTASSSNVASVPLATRFEQANTQFNTTLSNNMRVIYAPDGMNNFGNYNGEQSQFNLYNVTHWQYIDKLIWFGGTADQTVLIPSAPWVNAAHRNGVKVYGNVFFAPTAFGGNDNTIANFLQRDGNGNFIAAQRLVEIANYYGFDGWFVNQETGTNSTNGQNMLAFLKQLESALPADKDLIWYDAMLTSGSVSWQNQLNNNNRVFLQDGNTRTSDGMFINFFWNNSGGPNTSRTTAGNIGRSEFDVFTGVDLWPTRSQGPFENDGNSWMGDMHDSNGPVTSVAFFVPDVIFRNDRYSNFRTDASQFNQFYSFEKLFFAGQDRNPAIEDGSGFKGLSNWVPAASVITSLPFETEFNTGHGQSKFSNGSVSSTADWHNMDEQDILPTWQFAFEGNSNLSGQFIFNDAFNGGSSVEISGSLAAGGSTTMKLYKTRLEVTNGSELELVYKSGSSGATNMRLAVAFSDNPSNIITFELGNSPGSGWNTTTFDLGSQSGKQLAIVGFQFSSSSAVSNYSMKIGKISIRNGSSQPAAPTANFSASSTTIVEGESVNFTDISGNSPTSWSWNFTGGTPGTSNSQNPTITYNTAGTYEVSLTATNAQGSDTETKSGFITVNEPSNRVDHTDPPGTGTITARAEINSSEDRFKAFDNLFSSNNGTKWLDNGGVPSTSNPSWIQIQLPSAKVVDNLSIVSANDVPARDPQNFVLRGSNDGTNFTNLGSWSGENFANRFQSRDFPFSNSTAYTYYRLEITKNNGNISMTQLGEIMLIGPAGDGPSDPPPANNSLDFNAITLGSYSNQDADGTFNVLDGGNTVELQNNTWKISNETYNITANTVVEFEFRSTNQGEIHGIGFDEDNNLSSNRIFKVHGTQNWGIRTFDNYDGSGNFVAYSIPIGQSYTGATLRLVLCNDNDGGSGNNSQFRNVRLVESSGARTANAASEIINELDDEVTGQIELFPNPFSEKIELKLPLEMQKLTIEILSISGKELRNYELSEHSGRVILDLADMDYHGVIFIRMNLGEEVLMKKLIKE